MFVEQLAGEIAGARTLARLDNLARLVWQGWSAGAVPEDAAQSLAEAVHSRKVEVRGTIIPVGIPAGRQSIFRPRRVQVTPDRARSRERRRRLAFSGPLPPAIAARFRPAELAVMRIVLDEVRAHGACSISTAAIAARAGCGRSTVQSSIKLAAGMGLVTVQERRRQGRVNDTNIVRVVSRKVLDWLAKGRRQSVSIIGSKKVDPTDKTDSYPARTNHATRTERNSTSADRKVCARPISPNRPRRL